jgi:hypothetical protein
MGTRRKLVIATSRYFPKDARVTLSGLVPLGHTVGTPRFGGPEAGNLGLLAPHGLLGKDVTEEEFERRYRARLDEIGADKIRRVLSAIADAYGAAGVVLLCYEDVHAGESCHRRMFADWWQEQTGETVDELDPVQAAIPVTS